ncbi:hypothetical protein Q3G72_009473 [Acer saccharum]|nr:hypothetical protein Q3G72_009473 [Acer saccharum]
MCVFLNCKDLVDVDDLKVRETVSTMFKCTTPVTKSELERIVSSKAKKIYTDTCYKTRTRRAGIAEKRILALDSAIAGLHKLVYDMGSCLEERCAICLAGFGAGEEIHRTPCVHDFHGTCIANWLKMSHLCPLYRFPLLVCGNTKALCPFKEEGPLPSNHRVYRTKSRMSTRLAPWACRQVFGKITMVDPIN